MKNVLFIFLCSIFLTACGKSDEVKEKELNQACHKLANDVLRHRKSENFVSETRPESITSGSVYKILLNATLKNKMSNQTRDTTIECNLSFDGVPPSFDQDIEPHSIKIDNEPFEIP